VQAQAGDRGAALEEARLAVERLVLPGGQAAELLPRAPSVLLCQARPCLLLHQELSVC
jgi:hypothetical protein